MSSEYAYCSVSISPLRKLPSDSSEMVSQFIFGEVMEILEMDKQWRKVKSRVDNYDGWLDEKCISSLTESEMMIWEKEQSLLYNPTLLLNSDEGPIYITKGAFVSKNEVEFIIGKEKYSSSQERLRIPIAVTEIAKSFLNAPYLWGGKTLFGIDCSGFTQSVFRFIGIALPRDASMQVNEGNTISFSERQEGDLAFFINGKGNIHHVGIILSEKTIIHAHGWLRIDEYNEKGIIGRGIEENSHILAFIKRFV